jgi:hypothetical protein
MFLSYTPFLKNVRTSVIVTRHVILARYVPAGIDTTR